MLEDSMSPGASTDPVAAAGATFDTATIVWVEGGGCDGCTMAVLGATSPRLEELLAGGLTRARVNLVHQALALDSGDAYTQLLHDAVEGRLDPYILVVEGTMFDESLAGEGSFSRLSQIDGKPATIEDWVTRLAPGAAAVVAIGTCATWGGIPAAAGNPTGSTSLSGLLGTDFASAAGLPVVNVPGCAPNGDAFIEVVSYTLLHLEGLVPLDLDEKSQPRWLYGETSLLERQDVPYVERATAEPMHADCPVPARGWINRLGGCGEVGGNCNGCTRPDFPDRTLPAVVVRKGLNVL